MNVKPMGGFVSQYGSQILSWINPLDGKYACVDFSQEMQQSQKQEMASSELKTLQQESKEEGMEDVGLKKTGE